MARPPYPEPTTRKTLALPEALWGELDIERRLAPGRMPSETEMVRTLLREAIDARLRNRGLETAAAD